MNQPTLVKTLQRLAHPRIFGTLVGRFPYPSQEVALICPHQNQLNIWGRDSGKTTVGTGDNMARMAAIHPLLRAALDGIEKPIPFRGVLIANTKEQAFEAQNAINGCFERDEWLASQKHNSSTKTNLRLGKDREILIRPATQAARGQHAQTMLTKIGTINGIIVVIQDEAWFIDMPNFQNGVIKPMFGSAGKGSKNIKNTTPFGQEGELWDEYSAPTTGRCMQRFVFKKSEVDGVHRRVYDFIDTEGEFGEKGKQISFDRDICRVCMSKYKSVIHTFPTSENPHVSAKWLLDEKKLLYAQGRKSTYLQEYGGTPESTAGLFFNDNHRKMMFDDELPQWRIGADGVVKTLKLRNGDSWDDDEGVYEDIAGDFRGQQGWEYVLGFDANQGIESARADFAAVTILAIRGSTVRLLLCQKFLTPLKWFEGREYGKHELKQFTIDLCLFLFWYFKCRKARIDQGFGQAEFAALQQKFGQNAVEYVKTSTQGKNEALLGFKALIEAGRFKSPMIKFLLDETRRINLDQDSLDDDKVRISKVAGWGTKEKTVDGIYSTAYACLEADKPLIDVQAEIIDQYDLSEEHSWLKDYSAVGKEDFLGSVLQED